MSKLNRTRGLLYTIARILSDWNAVTKGKPGKRLLRRAAGKASGRVLRSLFK